MLPVPDLPLSTPRKRWLHTPYLLSRSFAGKQVSTRRNVVKPSKRVREVRISWEQAVIHQQPPKEGAQSPCTAPLCANTPKAFTPSKHFISRDSLFVTVTCARLF